MPSREVVTISNLYGSFFPAFLLNLAQFLNTIADLIRFNLIALIANKSEVYFSTCILVFVYYTVFLLVFMSSFLLWCVGGCLTFP